MEYSCFSITVLERLLKVKGINLSAVVLLHTGASISHLSSVFPAITLAGRKSVSALARNAHIPLVYYQSVNSEPVCNRLELLNPDFMLIACFPCLLPEEIRQIAKYACLNLHPSLLPGYRGPSPLFWQLRADEVSTGVTLHKAEQVVDSGEIVGQAAVPLPSGFTQEGLEVLLGGAGADLFSTVMNDWSTTVGRGQDESQASYQPFPCARDYTLPVNWSAKRAFNFVCGTEYASLVYTVTGAGKPLAIRSVIDHKPSGILGVSYKLDEESVKIQFSPGILHAILAG